MVMKKKFLVLLLALAGVFLVMTPTVYEASDGPYSVSLTATSAKSTNFTISAAQTVYLTYSGGNVGTGHYVKIKQGGKTLWTASAYWVFMNNGYYSSLWGYGSVSLSPGQYTLEAFGGTEAGGYGSIGVTLKHMKNGTLKMVVNSAYSLQPRINTPVHYTWSGQIYSGSITQSAAFNISNTSISGGRSGSSGSFTATAGATYKITCDGGYMKDYYGNITGHYPAYVEFYYDDPPLEDQIAVSFPGGTPNPNDGKITTRNPVVISWTNQVKGGASDNRTYKIFESKDGVPDIELPFSYLSQGSGNFSAQITGNLSPGNHTIYVQAMDDGQNKVSSSQYLLAVDSLAIKPVNIAMGYYHTVFCKSDGTVWAWGRNGYGQLGDGTNVDQKAPVQVKGPGGSGYLMDIVAVSVGPFNSFALKKDGTVWSWGYNNQGQLGDGTTMDQWVPAQVKGVGGTGYLTDIVAISNGSVHTMALKNDGTVWCWGNDGDTGTGGPSSTPLQVKGPNGAGFLTDVIAVNCSPSNSSVLKRDGSVWAWGNYNYGEPGAGCRYSAYPERVPNLTNIVTIMSGSDTNAALRNDGTIWTWGANYYNQLGDGTSTVQSPPVQVKGADSQPLTNVKSFSFSGFHGLAIKNDNSVWAWGYNAYSQLGDGTTINRSLAIQVRGVDGNGNLINPAMIHTGYYTSAALMDDGTLLMWGNNQNGQIGDGTVINKLYPTKVIFNQGGQDTTPPTIIVTGNDGWSNAASVNIAATATDSGSGIDPSTWQFKIGDGDWQPGSVTTIYQEGTTNVTFRVRDNAGNTSLETDTTVLIDRTSPFISASGNNDWENAVSVKAMATALDTGSGVNETTWQYKVDDGAWEPGDAVVITKEGYTAVSFRVYDKAGNLSQEAGTSVYIDRTPPQITVSDSIDWTNRTSVTVNATATDSLSGVNPATWSYKVDNRDWSGESSANCSPAITEEGEHYVYFRVRDYAGNLSDVSGYVTVRIDRSLPVVASLNITGAVNGFWSNHPDPVTVKASLADDAPGSVITKQYSYDGTQWITDNTPGNSISISVNREGVTRLWFRGMDQAGNMTPEGDPAYPNWVTIMLDRSGPVITDVQLANDYGNQWLKVQSLTAVDTYAGVPVPARFRYRFGDSDPWVDSQTGSAISLEGLAEGDCQIQLQALDELGNPGEAARLDFRVDRTPPSISGLQVKVDASSLTELSEAGYSPSSSVYLHINAADGYADGLPGRIAGYKYLVGSSWTAAPNFSDSRWQTDSSFQVSNLNNGVNYLYLKAVDGAGNESNLFIRIIRVDDVIPGKPNIISAHHPQARTPQDAVAARDALFTLSPAVSGGSGIKSYRYLLHKGNLVFDSGMANQARLEFSNLPDNAASEYYRLSVWAVAGNGYESLEPSEFTFRIDTTPPQLLKVTSATHASPDQWYPTAMATLEWSQPADFTGIKSYYYQVSTQNDFNFQDLTGWIPTSDSKIILDLRTCAGVTLNSGIVFLAVCAEDYAGNRQFSQTSLRFDTEPPFVTGAKPVQVTPDQLGREAMVAWGQPQDNVGISRVELRLAKYGEAQAESHWLVKPGTSGSEIFTGLDDGVIYLITVKVADWAGNEKYYSQGFTLDDPEVDVEIATPFVANIQGYTLSGTTYSGATPGQAFLELPKALNFRRVESGVETPISLLPLTGNLQFSGDQFITGASDLQYKVTLGGYEFSGQGIGFSRDKGLWFQHLTYTTETSPGTVKSFGYDQVFVSPPPQLLINEVTANDNAGFEFIAYRNGDEPKAPGFHFTRINTTGFKLNQWFLKDGQIDLGAMGGFVTGDEGQTSPWVKIKNIAVSPQGVIYGGKIDEIFFLEKGGNRFEVTQALVAADKIVILEAKVHFNSGFSNNPLIIKNFALTLDGNIIQNNDFSSAPFAFTIGGVTYTINSLGFNGNELIIHSGTITYGPGDQLAFKNMVLCTKGIADGIPVTIPGFSQTFFGFTVSSESGVLRNDGLYFDSITVHLPTSLGGPKILRGLRLDPSNHTTILAPAVGSEAYDLIPADFGTTAQIRELVLNSQGMFAARVTTTLPDLAGGKVCDFYDIPLSPGGMGSSAATDLTFSLYGFALAGKAVFDGSKIRLDSLNLALPTGFAPDKVNLTGLEFAKSKVAAAGTCNPETSLVKDGWSYQLTNIALAESGLTGEAGLDLAVFSGGKIQLSGFTIGATGEIDLGRITGAPRIRLYGWTTQITRITIQGGALSCNGQVVIADDFKLGSLVGKQIPLGEFKLSCDGGCTGFKGILNQEIELYSSNEVTAAIGPVEINEVGLSVSNGRISFTGEYPCEALRNTELKITKLQLDPAGKTKELQAAVSFTGLADRQLFGGLMLRNGLIGVDFFDGGRPLAFEVGGTIIFPATAPGVLANRELTIHSLKFDSLGRLVNLDAAVDLPENGDFIGGLKFGKNCQIGVKTSGEPVEFYVIGNLILPANAPGCLAGQTLAISSLRLNTYGRLVDINGSLSLAENSPLMGGIRLGKNCAVSIAKNGDTLEFSLTGALKLPANAPGCLKDQELAIGSLRFDTNGRLIDLDISLSLAENSEFIGGLKFGPNSIVSLNMGTGVTPEITVTGSLIFPESAPGCLSKGILPIDILKFDTDGNLLKLQAALELPGIRPFINGLSLQDGRIGIDINQGEPMNFRMTGSIILPDSFPDGLKGLVLGIHSLSVDSNGNINDFDVRLNNINTSIFNAVRLQNGSISGRKASGSNEFIFSGAGVIVLPANLPGGFGNMNLNIQKLTLSSDTGLVDFQAGSSANLEFELFAGIKAGFTSLSIGSDGLSLTGNLTFPTTFPDGLAGMVIHLDNFAMDWNGTIQDVKAGIGQATISLAGFTTDITNLQFSRDGITLDSCILTLPANMNSQKVGVTNAGFRNDGSFYGTIVIPKIDRDIGGFRLKLISPGLDIQNKQITFTQAALQMPDFVGGSEINLNGVKLGPSGLVFNGAGFKLPDFTIAGGLGFRQMRVDFAMEGQNYYIAGGGMAIIPGAGTFSAEISFINQSNTYPIGIKQAAFSYRVYGLGLPLAATGLFLNEIKGGLTFGPPDEIPQKVRGMFDNGTRIMLGLSVADGTGGNIIRGSATVWVDITDWDWAFQGDMAVLRGMVSGQVIAALTDKGFYGSFRVELRFIRGQVEVWVFSLDGETKVNGSGKIQFGIPKGFICNYHFHKWGLRICVVIPDANLWGGAIGADFGVFTNGAEGFKGYADLPILGRVGFFVSSSGKLTIGNLSNYTLYQPFEASKALNGEAGLDGADIPAGSKVVQLENRPSGLIKDFYKFNVPAQNRGINSSLTNRSLLAANAGSQRTEGSEIDPNTGEVERIIFAVGFNDGDPLVTAISPSGKRFTKDDPGVITQYTEWGLMFAVLNPEPGEWSLEVANVISSDSYHVEVFGKIQTPEIKLSSPQFSGEHAGNSFKVTGNVQNANPGAKVAVYLSNERDSFLGKAVTETVIDSNSNFEATVDTTGLDEGEYFIFAGVKQISDLPESRAFAPGSVIVNHDGASLKAVTGFIAADNGQTGVDLRFTDINGERTHGFYLDIENLTRHTEERIWLGYVTHTTIPGFADGDILRLCVIPVDRQKREGERSVFQTVIMGSARADSNIFTVNQENIQLSLQIGAVYQGSIGITNHNPEQTNSAYDFADAKIVTAPDGIFMSFPNDVVNIAQTNSNLGYLLRASEQTPPGEYIIKISLANRGNRDNQQMVTIIVKLSYPDIRISDITPTAWSNLEAVALEVYGENFYPGVRLYLDDTELALNEARLNYLKAMIPAGVTPGTRLLRVIGPGGAEVDQTISIIAPDYTVIGQKTRANVMAGDEAEFYFTIKGENDFNGGVDFRLQNVPAGWNASLDRNSIQENQIGCVKVMVPVNEVLGAKTIQVVSGRGDILPLTINVSATYPDPVIASLSAYSGFTGDQVIIYGSGFGGAGMVKLGDQVLQIVEYTRDKITVVIPEGAITGVMKMERDGKTASGGIYYVKNKGFSIYSTVDEIRLQSGESETIPLNVKGYSKQVWLTADTPSDLITASLTNPAVIPNGTTGLTITAAGSIPNGVYPVTVTGTSDNVIIRKVIKVTVGDAFTITTENLPAAMENCAYYAALETANYTGTVSYSLVEGNLPLGLNLNASGVISGKPTETGNQSFTVKATDGPNHETTKRFTITVAENAWGQSDQDGGRTRYNPVKSPADSRILWTSKMYNGAREILVGGGMVYVLSDSAVYGLNSKTGGLAYQYPGRFIQAAYASNTLYLLDINQVFHAVDARFGQLKWRRENVRYFTSDGNLLLLSADNHIDAVDPASGSLTDQIDLELPSTGIDVWRNGQLLHASGDSLYHLTKTAWIKVFTSNTGEIKDMAADTKEIALLLGNGQLVILDEAYQVGRETLTSLVSGEIALTGDRLIISSNGKTAGYDRTTLAKLFERNLLETELAAAAEKVFIANENGLECLNGYSGANIWSLPEKQLDVAIAGENLFALSNNGRVSCFNGPDNLSYPSTSLTAIPNLPDGSNGYYTTTPQVTLQSTDRESYVMETKYRYQDLPLTLYQGPFTLPDGQYSLIFYSVDNHGYREPDQVQAFQVDTTKPSTTIVLTGNQGQHGFYLSPVNISLTAQDNVSGLDYLEYRLNDSAWANYNGQISLSREGTYTLKYRAKDRAGNLEDEKTIRIAIDLTDPEIYAWKTVEPGLALIFLWAVDGMAGVAKLEYQIDQGPIQNYLYPIALTAPGQHEVAYRAVDKGGRGSGWRTLRVEVPIFRKGEWITDLKFANPMPGREIVRNVNVGEKLYGPGKDHKFGLAALPAYLKGADFIRTHIADKEYAGETFITFTAGADIDVYIMKHKFSHANLAGWTLVDKAFPVEPKLYFKGGADIYRRSFTRGERVVIPGSDVKGGWGNLYFVQYSLNNYLRIIGPMPEGKLTPLSKVSYTAVFKSDAGFTPSKNGAYEWQVKYDDGDWMLLSNTLSGEFTLSYTAGQMRMQLKLKVVFPDKNQVLEDTATYQVVNQSRIELFNPWPGTAILMGKSTMIRCKAYNMAGEEIAQSGVNFQISYDGLTYQDISSDHVLMADRTGPLFLKARFPEDYPGAGTHIQERVNRLWVVERFYPMNPWAPAP